MKKIITTLIAIFIFGTCISYGQYNVLLNFTGLNGSEPSGGVTISGNNIYGTTSYGGYGSGCLYTLRRDGSGYKNLYNFVDSTGDLPNNTVTLYNGKLYGTTFEGGSFRYYGVVYSVDTDGSNYKVLLNFNYTNGDEPPTDLLLSGTRIYGIASGGGYYGGGCIFTIDTDGNNYKDLYDFGAASGDAPYCKLLLAGTKFYGTTFDAGTYGGGTVFSIDSDGSNYTVMHNFGSGTEASNPYATLTLVGRALFGTTYYGGTTNKGALFSIDTDGNGYKKILDFNGTNGANPDMGSLKFKGNRLWGMASNGGVYNKGLVFSIDTNGSGFIDRFDFNGTIGANPDAQLTFYGSSIYGETSFGGSRNDGIVFGADTNCFMGSILVSSDITCHGYNNGSASISVSGGVSPYTYLWSNSSTQSSVSSLNVGTYSITLSDNSGTCTQTIPFTITQPTVLSSATATVLSNVSCHGGNDGNASVTVTGGGTPYHYSWVNSAHAVVSTFNPAGPFLSAGTYMVTVSDNCSASATASVTITQPRTMTIGAGPINNVSCYGSDNGRATVTTAGGESPYLYSWTDASYVVISTSQSTPAILSAGSYTVTVTDNCGSRATASTTIIQPSHLRDSIVSVTAVGCNGGNGGSAIVGVKGGTYPYKYTWSPGGSTLVRASGLSAGSYYVVISDNNGCSLTIPTIATILQPAAIRDSLASITYPSCNGGTGSASVGVTGGTLPYLYIWSYAVSTTAMANNIPSRTYTVTIKDKYNCPSSPIVLTLTQPVAIRDTIVSSAKVNVLCNGRSNGSAMVGVKYGVGPYGYTWSPNVSTGATAIGLSAGVYSITVTDNNGCSSSVVKVTITQPGILRDSIKPVTCSNSLVIATMGVKGGTYPYTYAWSPGFGTKQQMTGLTPGTYTITVSDKNNCSNTITASLACPPVEPLQNEKNPSQPNVVDNISLYPNPNAGLFMIEIRKYELGITDVSIDIYNILGDKIYEQLNIQNPAFNINIINQPNGIYLMRITDKEGNLVSQKKVVKTN